MPEQASSLSDWLTEYVQGIVEHPESVQVREVRGQVTVVYQVTVNPEDVGRVKGRRGRVVQALCSVVELAGRNERLRHVIDVVDDQAAAEDKE